MRDIKYASVRYCPHLGHNVIMGGRPSKTGALSWECLNKEDCGYREKGCRNMLIPAVRDQTISAGKEA